MAATETLRTRLSSSQRSFNKYIFYDQKKFFFLQNEYIFKKDILIVTQSFSVSKYISEMRYIFFTF